MGRSQIDWRALAKHLPSVPLRDFELCSPAQHTHVAIDFIALHTGEEGPAVSHSVIAQALERLLEVWSEPAVDLSSIGYDITRLLGTLSASGEVDESRVASLEWAYLPAVENYGSPQVLHYELSRNPDFSTSGFASE